MKLPSWSRCYDKRANGTANPLELFIYGNEPAGKRAAQWRRELAAAIDFAKYEQPNDIADALCKLGWTPPFNK